MAIAGNTPELPNDTRSRYFEVKLLPAISEAIEDSDWGKKSNRTQTSCEKWLPLKRIATQAGPEREAQTGQLIKEDLEHQQ